MIPIAFDTDRALLDVHWLVREIGPRVHKSPQEADAVRGVIERLSEAGWTVRMRHGSPVACRGNSSILYLAHVDSVAGSPGAVDNAAGVAVLLELARNTSARDLCLGFPVGEEAGLRGSRALASGWDEPLQLVVSLDLIGTGSPTAIDLNRSWGSTELRWLKRHTAIEVPILHRIVGRALPQWRSDHGPFAATGTLAFQIMTRGPDAVFTRYHQATDDTVDPQAMLATATALDALAMNGPPPRGTPDPALAVGSWVIPGSVVWGAFGLGLLSGIPGLARPRALLPDAIRLLAMTGAAAIGMLLPLHIGFPVSEAEQTVYDVVGLEPTGWWNAAPWSVALAWAAWLFFWRALPGTGHPALPAAVLSMIALAIDPLVALPFSLAAVLVRVHPLFGAFPAVLLVRPEPLREFAFWGIMPPTAWPILFLAACAAVGRIRKGR